MDPGITTLLFLVSLLIAVTITIRVVSPSIILSRCAGPDEEEEDGGLIGYEDGGNGVAEREKISSSRRIRQDQWLRSLPDHRDPRPRDTGAGARFEIHIPAGSFRRNPADSASA
jgi:hypothetical protein